MMKLLEKLLGLGVIPPEWKQRIYGLLLAGIAVVELFYDIPDDLHTEAQMAKLATALAILAAFVLKKVRDAKS